LRPAQLRRLQFQLQHRHAVTKRLQAALEAHALLVGAAHLGRQVVVLAACGGLALLAVELECQCRLQARLGCGVVEASKCSPKR